MSGKKKQIGFQTKYDREEVRLEFMEYVDVLPRPLGWPKGSSAAAAGSPAPDHPETHPTHENTIVKNRITYHRAYRKLESHNVFTLAVSLLVLVLISTMVFIYHPQITDSMSSITANVLSETFPGGTVEVVSKAYISDNVSVVVMPGRYPTRKLSVFVAIISLIFLFCAISYSKVIDPKLVWLIFFSFINLTSALFFIYYAGYFPYDMEIFSTMYIKTEVGIWMSIPMILTVALLPVSIGIFRKVAVILGTLAWSVAFALIRYIAFLYLLRSTTYVFMALLFFMLGPFLDFTYIVGAYSLCVKKAGKKMEKRTSQWGWLY